jgi:hypothetical protein
MATIYLAGNFLAPRAEFDSILRVIGGVKMTIFQMIKEKRVKKRERQQLP